MLNGKILGDLKVSIFFFHCPKTGGTALTSILRKMYSDQEICPIIENNKPQHEIMSGNYRHYLNYKFYHGHYGKDIFCAVNHEHMAITSFRHPVSRIISLYNYFNSITIPEGEDEKVYYAVKTAQSVPFEEFIALRSEEISVYTENQQYRMLTNSPWSMEYKGSVSEAYSLIDNMPWYYICEYYELSVLFAKQHFIQTLSEIPRLNMTPSGKREKRIHEIDESTLRIIHDRNTEDMEIYRYSVVRLFDKI